MLSDVKRTLEGDFRRLVEGLTLHPESLEQWVQIQPIGMETGLVVTMRAHRSDFGRILGKLGVNFRALEVVAKQLGDRSKVPVVLAPMMEPTVGQFERHRFTPNVNWPAGREPFSAMVLGLVNQLFPLSPGKMEWHDVNDGSWKTRLVLTVCVPNFAMHDAKELAMALRTLFDAAGRKHGRIIELEVQRTEGDDDPGWQPRTAAGRHSD